MIYAAEALRQIGDLVAYYEERLYLEAIGNLRTALMNAERRIDLDPRAGLPAPRPYPGLTSPGRSWIKEGHYWIAYAPESPAVILAIFHDSANIPDRV